MRFCTLVQLVQFGMYICLPGLTTVHLLKNYPLQSSAGLTIGISSWTKIVVHSRHNIGAGKALTSPKKLTSILPDDNRLTRNAFKKLLLNIFLNYVKQNFLMTISLTASLPVWCLDNSMLPMNRDQDLSFDCLISCFRLKTINVSSCVVKT